ncbi:MAG TPA: hypothetical protein VGF80_01485 [Galbitalea sp.]|jgi:hypothetical protein
MTGSTTPTQAQPENVLGGSLLALLAIPVGVAALVLLWSIGFVASIVGFLVAFSAFWLYRRGSGGLVSRVGAWTVTLIVVVTLALGLWLSLVIDFAGGLGHLGNLGYPDFWTQFGSKFGVLVKEDVLSIVLVFVFGALGSFRILGRAFSTARQVPHPANLTGQSTTLPPAPTTYHDDIDAAPTGSADDKTAPPKIDG